jgi:thioredoxin-related protein
MRTGTIVKLLIVFLLIFASPGTRQAATSLKWHSYDEGMALGKSQGKKVFIHFWAEWCAYCHEMEQKTFRNPAVVALLNENFISVKVDTVKEQEVSAIFRINSLPDNWFFSEQGEPIAQRRGFIPPDTFIKILKYLNNQ